MRIVVCVKQVIQLGDQVEFNEDGLDIDPDFADRTLNESDACATEEALLLRERLGGEVVVVTVGGQPSDTALRRCLAIGADRAVRIDRAQTNDALSVAHALAEMVRDENPDMVLCGVQSSDSMQGATGTALAEYAGLPRVAVVIKLDYDEDARRAVVRRELEDGRVEVVEVMTPAVITVQTGINQPRHPNLRAIKRAEALEIEVRPAPGTGQAASRVRRMFVPRRDKRAAPIEGNPAEVAARIAEIVNQRLR